MAARKQQLKLFKRYLTQNFAVLLSVTLSAKAFYITSVRLHQRFFFDFLTLFLDLLLAILIIPTGFAWFGEIVTVGAIGLLVADAVH
ncbi:MAG: hypothetical protein F6K42_12410 [Leptolyngbya sp. SIO1D8]|nr:hypothetical protein [Leptolyngbya sp. SIO1D8]